MGQIVGAGLRGGRGDAGPPFRVDAQGTLAERANYNNELANFTYLAEDNGYLYFKGSLPGQWSGGMLFRGPTGAVGASFILRGQLPATSDLPATGEIGHAWLIDGHAWVWGGSSWTDAGQIQGEPGKNGIDGADGRGVAMAVMDGSGHLVVTMTDGTVIDVGLVKGAPGTNGTNGTNGTSITGVAVNGSGHLIVTLSTGATTDAGLIPVINGAPGAPGLGITGVSINGNNHLIVTLSDGSQADAGVLPVGPEMEQALADQQQTITTLTSSLDALLLRIETLESYHAVPENALTDASGSPLTDQNGDYLTFGVAA